jgi:hypothetical protein
MLASLNVQRNADPELEQSMYLKLTNRYLTSSQEETYTQNDHSLNIELNGDDRNYSTGKPGGDYQSEYVDSAQNNNYDSTYDSQAMQYDDTPVNNVAYANGDGLNDGTSLQTYEYVSGEYDYTQQSYEQYQNGAEDELNYGNTGNDAQYESFSAYTSGYDEEGGNEQQQNHDIDYADTQNTQAYTHYNQDVIDNDALIENTNGYEDYSPSLSDNGQSVPLENTNGYEDYTLSLSATGQSDTVPNDQYNVPTTSYNSHRGASLPSNPVKKNHNIPAHSKHQSLSVLDNPEHTPRPLSPFAQPSYVCKGGQEVGEANYTSQLAEEQEVGEPKYASKRADEQEVSEPKDTQILNSPPKLPHSVPHMTNPGYITSSPSKQTYSPMAKSPMNQVNARKVEEMLNNAPLKKHVAAIGNNPIKMSPKLTSKALHSAYSSFQNLSSEKSSSGQLLSNPLLGRNVLPSRAESFKASLANVMKDDGSKKSAFRMKKSMDDINCLTDNTDTLFMTGEFGEINQPGGLLKIIPIESQLQVSYTWTLKHLDHNSDEKVVSMPFGPRDWQWQLM